MPAVQFADLPADARVWVFAASDSLTPGAEETMLHEVDAYLDQWKAHGEPLRCAREWREGRFLAVGVDQRSAGASGCSIDALFRILHGLQHRLGTDLVGGGRVFYRAKSGVIVSCDRASFANAAREGEIDAMTEVFDLSVTTAEGWRTSFAGRAADSWHSALLNAVRT